MCLEHLDCSYRWGFTAKIQYAILISSQHGARSGYYKHIKLIIRVNKTREGTLQFGTLSTQALKSTVDKI